LGKRENGSPEIKKNRQTTKFILLQLNIICGKKKIVRIPGTKSIKDMAKYSSKYCQLFV